MFKMRLFRQILRGYKNALVSEFIFFFHYFFFHCITTHPKMHNKNFATTLNQPFIKISVYPEAFN